MSVYTIPSEYKVNKKLKFNVKVVGGRIEVSTVGTYKNLGTGYIGPIKWQTHDLTGFLDCAEIVQPEIEKCAQYIVSILKYDGVWKKICKCPD